MFNLCWQLALKDLWQDRKVSLCMIAALVAVIAPLLLLFGLKQGVVQQLQRELSQKPNLLEIKTQGNTHQLSQEWLQALQARTDVQFAIGLTRSLNTEAQVFKTEQAAKHNVTDHFYSELIPTASGDPLLKNSPLALNPLNNEQVVVSAALAQKLQVKTGDALYFKLGRTTHGQKIFAYIPTTITQVLAPKDYPRAAAFVSTPFLLGVEYFMDGLTDTFSPIQPTPPSYHFANVRLYAQSMEDVLALSQWLETQHIPNQSQQAAIHSTLTINTVLNLIFSVIALTALVGGSVSLIGFLLANIDRKRQLIALLRLIGFNKKNIALYISSQIIFIALCAFLSALLFYFIGSSIFNSALSTHQQTSAFSTFLSPTQLGVALGLSLALAIGAALAGVIQAIRIDPAESLREL